MNSKGATTHYEDIQDLENMFPNIRVKQNVPWVDENNIVTSAGISAGIDMSLYLVSGFSNKKLAEDTAPQMEYFWKYGKK